MDFTNAVTMKTEYTFSDLTKPVNREYMQTLGVTTLGTKSGGFGYFQPQFKVVSIDAVEEIRSEVHELTNSENMLFSEALDMRPTLKELLK